MFYPGGETPLGVLNFAKKRHGEVSVFGSREVVIATLVMCSGRLVVGSGCGLVGLVGVG